MKQVTLLLNLIRGDS